jgi:hypothetical protein
MARRSALLAKQVISVRSARSLGFVSQLWVDASSVCTGCLSLCNACTYLLLHVFCGSEQFMGDAVMVIILYAVLLRDDMLL